MGTDKQFELRISKNGKYLMEGNKPFFWLGDTAWKLFEECNLEESYIYLKNRKEKGFNVIQAVLFNRDASITLDENKLNSNCITDKRYWEHCDKVIKMAEDLGLYMALLPSWGAVVKEGILNMDNVKEYGTFLGEHYKNNKNIIWLLGGDIRGDVNLEYFNTLGTILKQYNPERRMGYHPFGRTSSSLWFQDEKWLDFNMFQSGHRRYDQCSLGAWDDNKEKEGWFGEDNWKYVDRDHSHEVMKPTVDGEPSYEGIPQGLHDSTQPYWRAVHVRRYAYWSVFEGAMGHTYGSNAIMQFYNDLTKPGGYGVKEVWQDAIHHEGSDSMKHLKDLMESVNFTEGRAADELLVGGQRECHERIAVFAGKDFVFCYDYLGKAFALNLKDYTGMEAYWFNPQTGVYSFIEKIDGMKEEVNFTPVKKENQDNDWVLVIRKEA